MDSAVSRLEPLAPSGTMPSPARMAAPDITAGFTDMQWYMYHQRNVAFFAAFTARAFTADDLLAAARALLDQPLDAEAIARKAMAIAAEICVYTNGNVTVKRG